MTIKAGIKTQIKNTMKANKLFYDATRFNVSANHMDMLFAIYMTEGEGLSKIEISRVLGCQPGAAGRTAEIYTREGLPGVKDSGFDLLKHGPYDRNRPQSNAMILTEKGEALVESYLAALKGG